MTAVSLHSAAAQDIQNGQTVRNLQHVWLELTGKCNLTCQHCYVSSGPHLPLHGRMRHTDWLGTIQGAADLGCPSIQFIGGEPMLYPQLRELLELSAACAFKHIEIYTNGTAITDGWADTLAGLNVSVASSLYAATPYKHDTITRKCGSFERTVEGLRRLRGRGIAVRVGFIEMEENAGEFPATRQFLLSELGIENVGCDQTRRFGRGVVAGAGAQHDKDKFGDLCGQCWKGRMCVTASGDVYPCIMGRAFKIGNILDDGFRAVAESEELRQFRSEYSAHSRSSENCKPSGCSPDDYCRPDRCRPAFQ